MTSTTFWQKTAAPPTSCCSSNKNAVQLDASELSAISSTDKGCCSLSREEVIRERAYFLWEEAGRPEGDGVDFWIEAEKQFS